LLYQGSLDELVAADKTVKLTVDRMEEAHELLAADPALSVVRNGDGSLYVKMSDEQIPMVNRLLVERGFRVMELSPQRETLEDVFIRLTSPKAGTDRYIQ
jgi:ABC-type multidrug transport system ATPase subunit